MATASIGSLWFVLQFVVNHEVESAAATVINPAQSIDWGMHQVITSHNYAVESPMSLEISGGLNLQVLATTNYV
jgi:hypothetical protein